MPLDASLVGHTYPPSEPYLVDSGKDPRVRRRDWRARCVRTATAQTAVALGHPDVIAPPTFPVMLSLVLNQELIDDPLLDGDFSRVVHGDQRFAYRRPVRAGDQLVCVSSIEAIMARAGHEFLTTRTEISTDSGEPVVTVWSRIVIRGDGEAT